MVICVHKQAGENRNKIDYPNQMPPTQPYRTGVPSANMATSAESSTPKPYCKEPTTSDAAPALSGNRPRALTMEFATINPLAETKKKMGSHQTQRPAPVGACIVGQHQAGKIDAVVPLRQTRSGEAPVRGLLH